MVLLLLPWRCALHKALDVPCFDKDSFLFWAVFHCLHLRRLWSCRRTFSSCLESAGLRQNLITLFFFILPPSLLSLSVLPSSSHSFVPCPLLHIPLFLFFYPSSFTISFDHLFKKNVEFCPGEMFPVCLLHHWYHQLCTHFLLHVPNLPNPELGMSMTTPGWGVISGVPEQTPPFSVWMKSLQAVAEIRPKCVRYQMVTTLKIAHSWTRGAFSVFLNW